MDQPFSHDVLFDGVKPGNQFILAAVSGVIVALICALIWLAIAFSVGPQLDYLSLGVGVLIGLSIRVSGKGTTPVYGVLAMGLTLISSVSGNILGVIASASHDNFDIFTVAQTVKLPDVIMSILTQATPMTYLLFTSGLVLAFLVAVRR